MVPRPTLPSPTALLDGPKAALDAGRRAAWSLRRTTEQRVSVVTLNIGAAAARRAEAILDWLTTRRDDVIVLTETSAGLGTRLLMLALEDSGYAVHGTPSAGARDRGVVVATRIPVRESLDKHLDVTLPWRAVGLVLDTDEPIALLGVYVPSRDRSPVKVERKRAFIQSLLHSVAALPEALRARLLLLGDYNVVSRAHQPRLPGFFAYEYAMHDELERIGFAAGHELCGHAAQPHSWIGRTGTGYLYDYVHAGAALHHHLTGCEYLDDPRTLRLSDHAAVAAQIRLA